MSEALGNAARHAGAKSVDVRILRGPDGVSAKIHDNGAGFDVDAELERAGRGLGLLEMRERALHVGGRALYPELGGGGNDGFYQHALRYREMTMEAIAR